MTIVKEDARGFYVTVGDRVGRPDPKEYPKELRAGQEVRAMALPEQEVVRVRYNGGEHFWEMHVGRRTGGKEPELEFEAGQLWEMRGGGTVRVRELVDPTTQRYADGWRAKFDDRSWRGPNGFYYPDTESAKDVVRLVG
jgi:hypothetical protein